MEKLKYESLEAQERIMDMRPRGQKQFDTIDYVLGNDMFEWSSYLPTRHSSRKDQFLHRQV